MQYLTITPPSVFVSFIIIFPLFFQNECRYPVIALLLYFTIFFIQCLNDGEPILLGQNSNEFRCECLSGFFGPFCEYQDTSQSIKEKSPTPVSKKEIFQKNLTEFCFVRFLIKILLRPQLRYSLIQPIMVQL